MNFSKKQMIIGAAVLVAGVLIYKKFYKKPAVPAVPAVPPVSTETESTETESTDEDLTDEVITGASTEGFLGRGKKNGKPMGNRKERIAKYYLGLIKRGVDPMEAQEKIANKIKGNKAKQKQKEAALAELAEVVSTPKATLVEVAEARVVGGGDGYMSQSFVM
jgi:hypothetical protein